jgi:hypothetical protein
MISNPRKKVIFKIPSEVLRFNICLVVLNCMNRECLTSSLCYKHILTIVSDDRSEPWGLYYNTFYPRNLLIFVIS